MAPPLPSRSGMMRDSVKTKKTLLIENRTQEGNGMFHQRIFATGASLYMVAALGLAVLFVLLAG